MESLYNKYERDCKHFIPFIMAGDPSEDVTIELALRLEKKGATVLELGVPYSDPIADGPVIQRASIRARKAGMNIVKAIKLGRKLKENGLKIPIILFTYYNPVLKLGTNRFFTLMQKNNIDGLLIPDLPYEESGEVRTLSKAYGIDYISMVAPNSDQRIKMIAQSAKGFLYCVSSFGVTGVRSDFKREIQTFIQKVRSVSEVPVVVGFGISKREHVEIFGNISDGVVIGSAIIQKVEELLPLLQDDSKIIQGLSLFETFIEELISKGNESGEENARQRTVEIAKTLSTWEANRGS